jgi:hypothetical protein
MRKRTMCVFRYAASWLQVMANSLYAAGSMVWHPPGSGETAATAVLGDGHERTHGFAPHRHDIIFY